MTTLNSQQQDLFLDRYALKDHEGNPIERTPDEMFDRVATAIADSEDEAHEFKQLLSDFKFVPGGRILAGAGAETEKTFYNCYVIPVETKARRLNNRELSDYNTLDSYNDAGSDSREAIFDTIGLMVDIMSRGGGVGINWSVLRPSKSYLSRVSGHSSGPVGWMDVASAAVGEVEQGGSRRGAAMFMLDDWHPDVLKFIEAKKEKGKIVNANISVAVSDAFMLAVDTGGSWTFRFPDTTHPDYNSSWDGDIERWEELGRPTVSFGEVSARDVWDAIATSAHASGEPGVVFLDRYNTQSTGRDVERLISVNPCGEQGLGPYSVCNLGAMNLHAYVTNGFDGDPVFNTQAFRRDVGTAIRFLDNVISKSFYFLPETENQQKRLRRIGLGVMGLADALVALGVRYGSFAAVTFTERIFQMMKDASIKSSQEIAARKGAAEAWRDNMWERPFLEEYHERTNEPKFPLRNIFLLTQAPTGTTSLLAGVNSGIEPFFALRTWREDRTGARWVIPQSLRDWVSDFEGTEAKVLDAPDYVVTSNEITVDEHIAMQAAVQRNVDSSVSKTINAPSGQSVEETARAFTEAYSSGLKGIAYYRDGSRSVQVLYHQDPNEKIKVLEQTIEELNAKLQLKKNQAGPPYAAVLPADWRIGGQSFALNFVGHPTNCVGSPVYEEGCQKCYTCNWTAC